MLHVRPLPPLPAAALALALAATGPAGAQDGEPAGPSDGGAPGRTTGFVLNDGGYADLPPTSPAPILRPSDPEDRAENDAADIANAADRLAETGPPPARRPGVVIRPGRAEKRSEPTDPPVYAALEADDRAFEACTAALADLGATFEPARPITDGDDRDCGIARPLDVSAIRPGIALRPDAVMRCETARALATWTREHVEPAADRLGRGAVTAIDHGSTYICRRRNNAATGKLSEHSFGNAVDVMGFRFADGEALRIEPREGGPAGRFQRAVREGSCEHFTTVLGPGSNAAHADHLHLDIKRRRSGYRLCE